MRFTTLRGEQSLAALTDKLYQDLTPQARVAAEKALLKANPLLRTFDRIKPGILLSVPELPGIRANTAGSDDDPAGQVKGLLLGALTTYQENLKERFDGKQTALKEESSNLDEASQGFNDGDWAQFHETKASLGNRAETLKDNTARLLKTIEMLAKDLEKFPS